MPTTAQELPGHHVLEQRQALAEGRPPVSMYSQASLRGCHQSLMPSYRLPHCVGDTISLDELGMVCDLDSATPKHFPDWHCDGDDAHVTGLHTSNHQSHMIASLASCEQLSQDANGFALNFGRDFRALHQFNHDHDCTSTCIKYVAKKCKEAAESVIKKVPLLHVDSFSISSFPLLTFAQRRTNPLPGVSEEEVKSWCPNLTSQSPPTMASSARPFSQETHLSVPQHLT